jgi:hypothetical protein
MCRRRPWLAAVAVCVALATSSAAGTTVLLTTYTLGDGACVGASSTAAFPSDTCVEHTAAATAVAFVNATCNATAAFVRTFSDPACVTLTASRTLPLGRCVALSSQLSQRVLCGAGSVAAGAVVLAAALLGFVT